MSLPVKTIQYTNQDTDEKYTCPPRQVREAECQEGAAGHCQAGVKGSRRWAESKLLDRKFNDGLKLDKLTFNTS